MMKAIVRGIATVLVIAAGSAGAYELWDYYMLSPWTRDAKVRADVVTIAPDVAGFVKGDAAVYVGIGEIWLEGDIGQALLQLAKEERCKYTRLNSTLGRFEPIGDLGEET